LCGGGLVQVKLVHGKKERIEWIGKESDGPRSESRLTVKRWPGTHIRRRFRRRSTHRKQSAHGNAMAA